MPLGHLCIFFFLISKCLFRFFAHFFEAVLILSFMSCLYILKINPLLVASFVNIFSHYEGCLLFLFMVSCAVLKLLNLTSSLLFIFVFISITLKVGQGESCCDLCQRVLCLCFPLRGL